MTCDGDGSIISARLARDEDARVQAQRKRRQTHLERALTYLHSRAEPELERVGRGEGLLQQRRAHWDREHTKYRRELDAVVVLLGNNGAKHHVDIVAHPGGDLDNCGELHAEELSDKLLGFEFVKTL